ncbi:MAG: hypothetical protein DHS20C11_05120 [Lysobacteraceae bacterium]|nr:MAG: hypothetical protein DHS20C11_05120 [Xanthomonadaceae bacterium]
MKVSVLNANSLRTALLQLIARHEQIYMAVAWAHMSLVADQLIENSHKFKSVIIGLDFCSSHPDFVDELVGVQNAFAFQKRGVCFHPKVYLFRTGDNVDAIVGSANLTKGGLGTNIETCLQLSCDANEAPIPALLAEIESHAADGQPVTQNLADEYRRQAEIAARHPRPSPLILPKEQNDSKKISFDLLRMSWADFLLAVEKDTNHDFSARLKLLRYVQTSLAQVSSFGELSCADRKVVAGVPHREASETSGLEQIGWFGSMIGSGAFVKLIATNSSAMAEAIDSIPRREVVTKDDYDKFCELFTDAFAGSARGGGRASATRLLAMKRPDVFACVTDGNVRGLANALDFAHSTLNLTNYWDRVVEPIRSASWYNSPRPTGSSAEAWDCRAALLDAIYYEARPERQ